MFVRTDLPLAQQIVQAVHAAYEAGRDYARDAPENDQRFSVVICQIPNEQKLLFEYERLRSNGVVATLFREPDIGSQATAFATEPVADRKFFSRYQLWKG